MIVCQNYFPFFFIIIKHFAIIFYINFYLNSLEGKIMAVSKKAPAKKTISTKKNVKASKATTKKNATKKSTAKAGIKFNKKPFKK